MPRVTFVKSARKDNPVAKKGESYYWWKFMQGGRGGPKRYSKERPKQSQLTQSEFWGAIYGLRESHEDTPAYDDLESSAEEIKGELESIRDETQGKYDNLPDGLQQGQSGELLQTRIDSVDNAISEIEGIDFDPFDESDIDPVDEDKIKEDLDVEEGEDAEEALKAAIEEANANRDSEVADAKSEKASEVWSEVIDALDNISD